MRKSDYDVFWKNVFHILKWIGIEMNWIGLELELEWITLYLLIHIKKYNIFHISLNLIAYNLSLNNVKITEHYLIININNFAIKQN